MGSAKIFAQSTVLYNSHWTLSKAQDCSLYYHCHKLTSFHSGNSSCQCFVDSPAATSFDESTILHDGTTVTNKQQGYYGLLSAIKLRTLWKDWIYHNIFIIVIISFFGGPCKFFPPFRGPVWHIQLLKCTIPAAAALLSQTSLQASKLR